MSQTAFLLQPKKKRGKHEVKPSLKVPNALIKKTNNKQIAALLRKGNENGHKKSTSKNID